LRVVNPAIDSLKLRLKVDRVRFTPEGRRLLFERKLLLTKGDIKKLLSKEVELEELEEQYLRDFKRYAYIPECLEEQGIKVRFLVVSRYFSFNPGLSGDYLEVLINSKLLKKRYFEGITSETVRLIWEEICSLGLFEVSFEDFLNGQAVDIDIKMDIEDISSEEFGRFIYLLNNIKTGELHLGVKNLGFQYSYRNKVSQYISKPFVKLYYKPVELVYGSPVFYRKFLEPLYGKEAYQLRLARVEGTIKNLKHLRHLGIKDNSLGYLLEQLTPERIRGILGSFLDKHLGLKANEKAKDILKGVEVKSRKPSDIDVYMLVKQFIKSGYTLEMVVSAVKFSYERHGVSKVSMYRKLNKVREAYQYLLEHDGDLKVERKFMDFLHLLFKEAHIQ